MFKEKSIYAYESVVLEYKNKKVTINKNLRELAIERNEWKKLKATWKETIYDIKNKNISLT